MLDPLEQLFGNLDRWRHLPAYQLERRADAVFAIYLKGLVEEVTGVPLEDELLPELPIKRDLNHQSVKVDYALFAKDRSQVFFVELKTDANSRRDKQDQYLEAAQRLGFRKIVQGVCAILRETKAHQKYHHLASALARLDYLKLPSDLEQFTYPAPRVGIRQRLAAIEVCGTDSRVDVLYVEPQATAGVPTIDFAQFAEYVARHNDPLSQAFAAHLLRWRTRAGSVAPF